MEAHSYPSSFLRVVWNPIPKPEPDLEDLEYQRIERNVRRKRRNTLICAIIFCQVMIMVIFMTLFLVLFLVIFPIYPWSFWTRLLEINMSSLFYVLILIFMANAGFNIGIRMISSTKIMKQSVKLLIQNIKH